MRNTPDAVRWIQTAHSEGVQAAIAQRDAPFGDYSQASAEGKPDPRNVIEP
jgi:enoyl-CoA hydratase